MKTMEWAEVTCCSASAVNSGKPTTTPSATTTSETISAREGRFWRKASSRHSARRPAIAARATVRKTGSSCMTATRVAGSEPLKITTPIIPLIHPLAIRSISMLLRFALIGGSGWQNQRQSCTVWQNCYGIGSHTDA